MPGDAEARAKVASSSRLMSGRQSIVVDVIDNGIGLPQENRQMLLEPYMTTREKGTGLGLAIVRKIVEEHAGTIELLDAPKVAKGGRGRWCVSPSRRRASRNRDNKSSTRAVDADGVRRRIWHRSRSMASDILIVDDEADIRDLVAGILEDEGHKTRSRRRFATPPSTKSRQRRPSLVFLDIWLQGSRLDGLALLDEIKREYADLPVVMISGHGNIETAVSAIKRGAYDYIEKPFKADRLVLVAERALEASRLRREVRDLQERSGER